MKVEDLISILETSVKKHGGDTQLTLGHLLNIVKMIERKEGYREWIEEKNHQVCMEAAFGGEHGQG